MGIGGRQLAVGNRRRAAQGHGAHRWAPHGSIVVDRMRDGAPPTAGRERGQGHSATFGNPNFDFRTGSREYRAAAIPSAHRPSMHVSRPAFQEKASHSQENRAGLTRQIERRTCGGRSKANGLRGKHGDKNMIIRLSGSSERWHNDGRRGKAPRFIAS